MSPAWELCPDEIWHVVHVPESGSKSATRIGSDGLLGSDLAHGAGPMKYHQAATDSPKSKEVENKTMSDRFLTSLVVGFLGGSAVMK